MLLGEVKFVAQNATPNFAAPHTAIKFMVLWRMIKFFDVVSAGAGNFELQNACVNLRTRSTYADLKFKSGANSKPAGGINFKFKNGANFGFLCDGNAKPLKSNGRANALSFSAAAEISDLVSAGEILKYGVTAGISALALASKILIPGIAGKILNLSAAHGYWA